MKKILAVILMVTTFVGSTIAVGAQELHPTVTFNEENTLTYSNVTEDTDGSISLGNAFEAVLPGETRSQVITLMNDNEHTVDFYMSADVVRSLESANRASGATYEIKLEADGNVLYDSTLGGYDAASEGSTEGLAEMNASLEGDIFVATLDENETADVILTITFDGEAMDSTDISDYSNALGALDFNFKAGYEESNAEEIVDTVVNRQGETVYRTEVVEIVDNTVPLAVKTGDNTMIFGAVAVLVIGAVLFLLTGKKKDKKNVGAFVGILICSMLSSVSANAAGTYTVTYRPGNVGNFALADTSETDVRAMAEEAAGAMGYSYEYEVTENGAIKIFVPKGASVPAAPSYIVAEGSYFAKNATLWGPVQGEIVEKNIDFVVDYGKLVDGVEYTIQYLDSADQSAIAPVAIAYGNIGTEETAVAPDTIVISGATTYVRDGEATQQIVLSADETQNVITFYYTAAVGEITENIIYQDVPGETVVVTEYVTIPGTAPGGAGAVLAPGQAEIEIPGEDVPLAPGPVEEGEVQQEVENQPEQPIVEPGGEEVQIPEEDVPLASTPSDSGDGIVDIGEEDVPLANMVSAQENNSGLYVGLGVVLAALMAVTVVWFKFTRRPKAEENPIDNKEE